MQPLVHVIPGVDTQDVSTDNEMHGSVSRFAGESVHLVVRVVLVRLQISC